MEESLSKVDCTLRVKFISEDNHVYKFDNTWNISIDDFQLINVEGRHLQAYFSFDAQLDMIDEDGSSVFCLPHEELPELQPYLEKIEILLDTLSFQSGTPLAIEDESMEFTCRGRMTRSNPVTNTISLYDIDGLNKRFLNLQKQEDLVNALRFSRLAQIDREANGKAVKLWATLEALYKGYEKEIETIWSSLAEQDQKELEKTVKSLNTTDAYKESLLNGLRERSKVSKTALLATKIKLMNDTGEYSKETVLKLLREWGSSRHSPAHGERIRPDDEQRREAIIDLEHTLETLLAGRLLPSLYGFFIGHPDDLNLDFWKKSDYTIKKMSESCWVRPSNLILDVHEEILKSIGAHKIRNNSPFLFVTHNRVVSISKDGIADLQQISQISENYSKAAEKAQKV